MRSAPPTKLLVLPLLFYHFERSARGMWVFIAFLASCTLLMVVSWIVAIRSQPLAEALPTSPMPATASSSRTTSPRARNSRCARWRSPIPIVTLLRDQARSGRRCCLTAVALSFVVNMVFVVVSRTALVTMPVMLAVFALLHLKWRTNVLLFVRRRRAWRRWPGRVSPQLQATDGHVRCGTTGSTRNSEPADVDRAAARILGEVAAVLCRGAGHRPRHRIDARAVRGGGDRASSAGAAAGDREPAQPDPERRGPVGRDRGRRAVRDVAGRICCCSAATGWRPGSG